MSEVEYVFKLVVLGEPGVGKSSLVNRFVHDRFATSYTFTIGLDIMTKRLVIDEDKRIRFIIADIGGQERFSVLRPRFYLGSKGGFLVFDLSRKETLYALETWKQDFEAVISNPNFMVIGNKSDLVSQREVSEEEAISFITNTLNLPASSYIEASAKTGSEVERAFEEFARIFVKRADALEPSC